MDLFLHKDIIHQFYNNLISPKLKSELSLFVYLCHLTCVSAKFKIAGTTASVL